MRSNFIKLSHADDEDKKYGIPELSKYPMPDAKHVRSAIKFFNYVTPAYEKELARSILKRMREYGMSFDDFTVGEENRFSKYIPKETSLEHHGILGQKWGVRRYQNEDGTYTKAGLRRLHKLDKKWVKKNERKLYNYAYNKSKNEINDFVRRELNPNIQKYNKNRKISATYANAYSRKLAQLMNKHIGDIESPSGKVVRFVAMRGEMKVATALADRGYDMRQVKSGVYGSSGKIAYKKKNVGIMNYDK